MTDSLKPEPTKEQVEAADAAFDEHLPLFSGATGERRWCSACAQSFESQEVARKHTMRAAVAAALAAGTAGLRPQRLIGQLNRLASALEECELEGAAADAPTWMRKAAEYIESNRQWRAPAQPAANDANPTT